MSICSFVKDEIGDAAPVGTAQYRINDQKEKVNRTDSRTL